MISLVNRTLLSFLKVMHYVPKELDDHRRVGILGVDQDAYMTSSAHLSFFFFFFLVSNLFRGIEC